MKIKISYKRKIFLYFFIVFIVFTGIIASFQYNRERQNKVKELETLLNSYSSFVNSYILHKNINETRKYHLIDSLTSFFPRTDIRVTVINFEGNVLYDSYYDNYTLMDNHSDRAEIIEALNYRKGSDIRLSETTGKNFYYYAKKYDDYYIRSAIYYDISINEFLRVENIFIYFIILLFLITTGILIYVSDKAGNSILKLKDFAIKAGRNENIDKPIYFPETEIGTIGNQIINIYNNLKQTNEKLAKEKEKLVHHLQNSQEGIAIFSKNNETIIANNHFIHYLNSISDIPVINADYFFKVDEFKSLIEFINYNIENNIENENLYLNNKLPVKKTTIEKNSKIFEVKCLIFADSSFEVSISNITEEEERKKLKQQMTSNIAHELRTPVSSIKGYLETIINTKDLKPEKSEYFIKKAFSQTERLTDLIKNIAILTKIEEAANLFEIEDIKISNVVFDVIENLQKKILLLNAKIDCNINQSTIIKGNNILIYSIFQNLLENSLKYGKENIEIYINEYMEDDNNVYFSFSDNGVGIDEEHHNKIFERFYRVDQGGEKSKGGSGLGLAIVKNAVRFHNGNIIVKKRNGEGTEFLFSLSKD